MSENKWDANKYRDQQFVIPKLKCDYPLVFNGHVESNKTQRRQWLQTLNLFPNQQVLDKYISYEIEYLGSSWCPFFNQQDTLAVLKITDLVVLVDDMFVETGKYSQADIDNLFSGKTADQSIIAREFTALFEYFESRSNARIVELFKRETKEHMSSALKYDNKFHESLTFDEYFDLRINDVAMKFVFLLCLVVGPHDFPLDLYDSPLFTRFHRVACVPFSLVNDLYSFGKEFDEPDYKNYVKVLTHQMGGPQHPTSIQLALTKMQEIFDCSLVAYDAVCAEIMSQYSTHPTICEYIKNNHIIMSTGIHFHQTIARYNNYKKTN
ncbi:hypothetical protein CYY_008114 [Polysphondylium violaceum]|uniref:Terpene synthase n=1 Tax=Polysphondylium violaceum TaxID=133409 RepID=A0A8J4PP38_9MYCE|nr:hypothetical protein CYY_008114 [Polysphondylium violaceum]